MLIMFLMFVSNRCFVVIQELSSLLSMEAMSFVTEDRKTPQESVSPNTYTFDLFGGVDVSDALHENLCCYVLQWRRELFDPLLIL